MSERVTYADTSADLHYLVSLGVPLVDVAERMGRSTQAVFAMLYPGQQQPANDDKNKQKGG